MKTKASKAKGKRAPKVKDLTVRRGERVKGGNNKNEGLTWHWG
jgi:hypothetical protein